MLAALGSGSAGNSTLIRSATTTLLLDCGFTLKETVARLEALSVSLADVDALIVTHEHSDHMRGVGPVSRKFGMPIWMTCGTYHACKDKKIAEPHLFHAHESFTIGDITLDPFPTPHDAAESCQFVFSADGARFACLTDLGAITPHVKAKIADVNAILVESNYDIEMLKNGPYPYPLQQRIRSNYGHLGNEQAGEILKEMDHPNLNTILLGHLSERNNTAQHAYNTVCGYIERNERVTVLEQHHSSEWFDVVGGGERVTATEEDSATDSTVPAASVAPV